MVSSQHNLVWKMKEEHGSNILPFKCPVNIYILSTVVLDDTLKYSNKHIQPLLFYTSRSKMKTKSMNFLRVHSTPDSLSSILH